MGDEHERRVSTRRNWLREMMTAIGLVACAGLAHAFDPGDLETLLARGECRGCDLSGADLRGRDLSGAQLQAAAAKLPNE